MVTEKRLIDANKLEETIRHDFYRVNITTADKVMDIIQSAPTVEAAEVMCGRWEKHGKHDWRCSVCKVGVPYSYTGHRYCHNCGAKMYGGR